MVMAKARMEMLRTEIARTVSWLGASVTSEKLVIGGKQRGAGEKGQLQGRIGPGEAFVRRMGGPRTHSETEREESTKRQKHPRGGDGEKALPTAGGGGGGDRGRGTGGGGGLISRLASGRRASKEL